jgi:acetyl esterase
MRFILACIALMIASGALAAEPAVTVRSDLIYSMSDQKIDVCVPGVPVKRAAVLFVHGGGFKSGSKADMLAFCNLYARGGFVAATIDYRLTPPNVFPAALDDVTSAIAWLKAQAGVYGFDADKLVIVGYSAGANLALMAGLADNSRVAAIVSVAAPTNLRAMIDGPTFEQAKQDIRAYLGGQSPDIASPIFRVTRGDPPVFLFHGQKDTFVPIEHSVAMAGLLKQNDVPVLLRVFPDSGHEIMLFGSAVQPLLEDMTKFIAAVDAK